jgi:hypothetical protein
VYYSAQIQTELESSRVDCFRIGKYSSASWWGHFDIASIAFCFLIFLIFILAQSTNLTFAVQNYEKNKNFSNYQESSCRILMNNLWLLSFFIDWAWLLSAVQKKRIFWKKNTRLPSMLIVAPRGSMNRVTRLSTLLFSSRHRNVMGRVAELNFICIFI